MPEIDPAFFQENERLTATDTGRQTVSIGPLAGLPDVVVAYETWGTFTGDNAILIQHALSGDAHAIGWWERLIGPGKAIDTDRYFVIGHNALGGCQGTTGPGSPDPDGKPWGSRFPKVRVEDMVDAQARLLEHLGVSRLWATAGGSMGGMMSLEWARRNAVDKVFVTASALAHSAMQIGFNETARQAIRRDPNFQGGDYYGGPAPAQGLAVGRMVGHLSYLSEAAFQAKFGRRRQNPGEDLFAVESYLNYQGDKFTHRFDANSLLVLTEAIDAYELTSLEGCKSEFLVVSFTSDWLYPPHQSEAIDALARAAGCRSEWHNLEAPGGHDSFLLDGERQGELVRAFLQRA